VHIYSCFWFDTGSSLRLQLACLVCQSLSSQAPGYLAVRDCNPWTIFQSRYFGIEKPSGIPGLQLLLADNCRLGQLAVWSANVTTLWCHGYTTDTVTGLLLLPARAYRKISYCHPFAKSFHLRTVSATAEKFLFGDRERSGLVTDCSWKSEPWTLKIQRLRRLFTYLFTYLPYDSRPDRSNVKS